MEIENSTPIKSLPPKKGKYLGAYQILVMKWSGSCYSVSLIMC